MLSNAELFSVVEAECIKSGVIERFEAENGTITGRMMIDAVDMPDDINLNPDVDGHIVAFEASFDFIDARIGFALSVTNMEAASDIWITNCSSDDLPDNSLVEFFIGKTVESIMPDGSYGIPIYVFITDEASFSCIPTAED